MTMHAAKGLEFDHVYVLGLQSRAHAGRRAGARSSRSPTRCCTEALPPDTRGRPRRRDAPPAARGDDARAASGSCSPTPARTDRGARAAAVAVRRGGARRARRASGRSARRSCSARPRRCTSTFRLLRDELLDDRLAGRRRASASCASTPTSTSPTRSCATSSCSSSRRCMERTGRGQAVADALPEVNARLLQAATAEQREIFQTSRARRRTCSTPSATRGRARAARRRRATSRRSSRSCPRRGDGPAAQRLGHRDLPDVPAEVQVRARLPDPERADDEPALRDPRPPGARALPRRARGRGRSTSCSGCSRRAGGAAASATREEERQLRGKADAALRRYHERFRAEDAEPVWFEKRVHVPARAAHCCAAASTASTGCPTAATS